jgi:hypothetical protein
LSDSSFLVKNAYKNPQMGHLDIDETPIEVTLLDADGHLRMDRRWQSRRRDEVGQATRICVPKASVPQFDHYFP